MPLSYIRASVYLKQEDKEFLKENAISLTQFVRNNIQKLKQAGPTVQGKPAMNQHEGG